MGLTALIGTKEVTQRQHGTHTRGPGSEESPDPVAAAASAVAAITATPPGPGSAVDGSRRIRRWACRAGPGRADRWNRPSIRSTAGGAARPPFRRRLVSVERNGVGDFRVVGCGRKPRSLVARDTPRSRPHGFGERTRTMRNSHRFCSVLWIASVGTSSNTPFEQSIRTIVSIYMSMCL